MNRKTSNPQPQAVDRINKQNDDKNPTNLHGNEGSKKSRQKEGMVKNRNRSRNK